MASGIKVTDEIKEVYRRLCLLPKKEGKLHFAVLKFHRQKEKVDLVLQFTSDDAPMNEENQRQLPNYDQLVGSLPEDDVRYLLCDVDFVTQEGTPKSQVFLLSWHPQCSPVKARLVCGSTFSALRQALSVSRYYIEADCQSEACGAALIDKFGFKEVVKTADVPDNVVRDLFAMEGPTTS